MLSEDDEDFDKKLTFYKQIFDALKDIDLTSLFTSLNEDKKDEKDIQS